MEKGVNYPDIIQIKEIAFSDKVNRHLNIGWILLGISSNQYSEHGYSLSYSVGWPKTNGAIKEPEKTEEEIELEQWGKESNL